MLWAIQAPFAVTQLILIDTPLTTSNLETILTSYSQLEHLEAYSTIMKMMPQCDFLHLTPYVLRHVFDHPSLEFAHLDVNTTQLYEGSDLRNSVMGGTTEKILIMNMVGSKRQNQVAINSIEGYFADDEWTRVYSEVRVNEERRVADVELARKPVDTVDMRLWARGASTGIWSDERKEYYRWWQEDASLLERTTSGRGMVVPDSQGL
jgi:hypothetical protein